MNTKQTEALSTDDKLSSLSNALDVLYRTIGRHELDNPNCQCQLRTHFNDAYRAFVAFCEENK